MKVIVRHRIDGRKEEVRGVECFREDTHYLYLNFNKDSKIKQRRYVRRNVKLSCVVEETADEKIAEEETADEYVRNHVIYEVAKREDGTNYAKEVSDVTIKQAFLAGLKAGRPKCSRIRREEDEEKAK